MDNERMAKKIRTALLLLALAACAQTGAQTTAPNDRHEGMAGWKTFDGIHYAVQYPPDWELNQSGQMGTSFIFLSPLDHETDRFRENVNLLVQDLTGSLVDIDRYVELSEGQVKTMMSNSVLLESTRMKNAGPEFHKMVWEADQGFYRLKFQQYIWIMHQQAYVLTLSCEKSAYADYRETGEKMLNSFVFNQR